MAMRKAEWQAKREMAFKSFEKGLRLEVVAERLNVCIFTIKEWWTVYQKKKNQIGEEL
jgi:uncharacterized protein YjcR